MRALVLAAGVLLMVAACGRVPGGQRSSGDYKLYEAASTSSALQLSVIDSRSHSVELNMPMGTPSAEWTHLYTVKGDMLIDLDPQTGFTQRTMRLPGLFQLPPATLSGVPGGLSQDGHWLVLQTFDQRSGGAPSASHFVVVDTWVGRSTKQVDLQGFFQFDAISNDGKRVFLIQYVSSSEYYVRFYDLGLGRLDPGIIFDKADGASAMAGLRLSGVASPDGQWLYSIYVRQDKSPFIHALSLDSYPIAFCIDLPGSGYASGNGADEFHWSLAMSRDGLHLYAANGAKGIVDDVYTGGNGPPLITRIAHIANGQSASLFAQDVQAKELGGNAAALSPDGRTLVMAGSTGVVWVDTASLRERDRQLAGWRISSLAISPDGTNLYAVSDGGMIAELPMTGTHSATTFGGAAGQPLALIRVAAA